MQLSLVFNTLANMLDMTPVISGVGEIGVHRPSQIHYVRFNEGKPSAIEILLCQENGEELPIIHGDVLCQLNIRRVHIIRV